MKINLTPTDLIDQLRAWFYARDRAIIIDPAIRAYNVPSGAILALAFIEEQELTASAASVVFSPIPQNFRKLVIDVQARTDRAAEIDSVNMQFNADAGANYDIILLRGNGTTASAVTARATTSINIVTIDGASSRASNFTPGTIEIPGYARTDRDKWAYCANSGSFGNVSADADVFVDVRRGRWQKQTSISSITLIPGVGPNFVSGSVFTLYGVL